MAVSVALLLTFASLELVAQQPLLIDRVDHHDVDNNGVNVHYVTLGEVVTGETLLFVHGFPNFWYVWHNQRSTATTHSSRTRASGTPSRSRPPTA